MHIQLNGYCIHIDFNYKLFKYYVNICSIYYMELTNLACLLTWRTKENCVDKREREFTVQEKRSPHISDEHWIQEYIYTDQYKNFFTFFSRKLYKWISRLVMQVRYFGNKPTTWNSDLIEKLKRIDNNIARFIT